MGVVFGRSVGEGAVLGPLEPWHKGEFFANLERAREYLAPWIPWANYILDVEAAGRFLQRLADNHAAGTEHPFGIWRGGELLGGVRCFDLSVAMGTCEVGAWLAPEYAGSGLATRSVRHVVDWAIRDRGMSRVQWANNPDNKRSSGVARRLGFTREGVLRSAFVVEGTRCDAEVWSMLAGDWPSL